jgi:DNA-binding transcriptional LysR family regulator
LAARRIAQFEGGLYASPHWLARHGPLTTPDDLMRCHGLLVRNQAGEPMPWLLRRAGSDERWQGQPAQCTLANMPAMLLQMAVAGAGVALAAHVYAVQWVKAGRLVRVLPEWQAPPASAWAVFPGRRLMPARTRLFIDMLVTEAARRCADC